MIIYQIIFSLCKVKDWLINIILSLNYRPFKCDKCDQGFYRNNILKEHMARCTVQASGAATENHEEEVPQAGKSNTDSMGELASDLKQEKLATENSSESEGIESDRVQQA